MSRWIVRIMLDGQEVSDSPGRDEESASMWFECLRDNEDTLKRCSAGRILVQLIDPAGIVVNAHEIRRKEEVKT